MCQGNGHKISLKTRLLNQLRAFLVGTDFERWASCSIRGSGILSPLLKRLIPNNYQYLKPSIRQFEHNGIVLNVDISDYIGHTVFFGLNTDLHKLFDLCRSNSIVFDIGVNIGWTAMNMSKICSCGQVYGFEPDTINFIACSKNLELNPDIRNLILTKVALGDQDAMVKMVVSEPTNLGGNRVGESSINAGDADVAMTTLDSFFSSRSLSRLDLVKIDTEGYELRILQGGFATLSNLHPVLFVEVNDNNLRRNGDSAKALIEFLHRAGYMNIVNSETGDAVQLGDDFSDIHMDIIARA
jgi:FkbM family methyltransferase